MLNSAEHEILNAHKYKKYPEIQHFSGSDKPRMLFFLLINVKMPTIVVFSITSGPDQVFACTLHGFSCYSVVCNKTYHSCSGLMILSSLQLTPTSQLLPTESLLERIYFFNETNAP